MDENDSKQKDWDHLKKIKSKTQIGIDLWDLDLICVKSFLW